MKAVQLVLGFTIDDVAYTGGNLTGFAQSETDPTLYTATFTQSGTTVAAPTFDIAANTYQDLASPANNGSAATQLTLAADWTPPTVAVSFSGTTISTGESKIVTFTFSENPGSSFTTSDITITNATLSGLAQTADPKIWTASIVSTSSRYSPVVTVLNNSYTDPAGNPGSSGTNTIRLIPPSIDLSNDPVSDTGVSSSDNITTKRNPIIAGKNNNALAFTSVLVQYYVSGTLTTLTYTTGTGITYTAADSTFTIDLSVATPTSGTWPSGGLPEGYVTLNLTTSTGALASNSFLIDITAPTPIPTVTAMAATYDASPTIQGTATVLDGEVLKVLVNGVTYTNGDGHLSLNGTAWTLIVPVANKIPAGFTYDVTATVTDAADNVSTDATSGELTINASNVTIDLENTSYSDTGSSSSDNITTNRKPILNGTASGSDTTVKISILDDGITYIYNSVSIVDGTYSLNLSTTSPNSIIPTGSFPAYGLPAGTVSISVEGNTSGSIGTNSFTIIELQTSNIVANPTFTTAQISWTNGSRGSRVVFLKEGTGDITNPHNFTTFTASNNWNSKGTQQETTGYYCIYNGSDAVGSVLVRNLYPGLTYTIRAFEYDGNEGTENYLTDVSGANNPNTFVPWPSTTFTNSVGVSTPEAWSTAARWNHDTIPSANLHPAVQVYIDGNCEITSDEAAHNLTILASHDAVSPKLTVNANKSLNIIGTSGGQLVNNGTAASLVIKASETLANGTLMYAAGTPQATVEMYSKAWWNLNEVVNSKYNWQFIGIPVQTVSNVTSIFSGGYVRVYNETGWGVTSSTNTAPVKRWTQLYDGASMQNIKCYEIVQSAPRFFTFTGLLFNGNINLNLSFTPRETNVKGEYPGQHLIGNPYTSAIDIKQIQFGANMEETVYIYNTGTFNSWGTNKASSGSNPGQYVAIPKNIASQTTPTNLQRQIPSMQAFLVKCTAATTLNINYSTAKVKDSVMQRAPKETNLPWLRIELRGATKGNDVLWLFKKEGTTREFDNGWDGYKMTGDAGMPRLFDSELVSNYQINTMPDLNETKLGFRAGTGETEYTLTLENYNMDITYDELYLLDVTTNQLIDIRNKTEYSFTATNTTSTQERFKILTYRPITTKIDEIKANVYYSDSKLFFQNMSEMNAHILLYDMSGREVFSSKVSAEESMSFDIQLLPGVYVCKIISDKMNTKKTVIVK